MNDAKIAVVAVTAKLGVAPRTAGFASRGLFWLATAASAAFVLIAAPADVRAAQRPNSQQSR